ncbi:RnfABCDGE type electron transport complex subunit D, partial [Klebsiella pneumoniae]
AVSVAACVAAEYVCCRLRKVENTVGDLSACVTGLLLAMSLPVTAPYWAPVLGGVFGIVVVKQFYGGLGRNFLNPALAGR